MTERPILFIAPMVRAILEGRKTQTRRAVNWDRQKIDGFSYVQPGDRLWVRETFALEDATGFPETIPTDGRPVKRIEYPEWIEVTFARYRATEYADLACGHEKCEGGPCQHPWSPSILMPRWASRITREITDVRFQRLQEITEEDAQAEGFDPKICDDLPDWTAKESFQIYWNSIYAKRGLGWDSNPWVRALSFVRTANGGTD